MGGGDAGVDQMGGAKEASLPQVDRMRNDTSLTLFNYWNGLRGARKAPHRVEIEPARIAGILPEAFILEKVDFETYRFRIAGTKLCEQFGRELRGRNFLDHWDEEDRFTLRRRLAAVAEQGAAGLFEFEAFGSGQEPVLFEAVILPLVHSNNAIDRFLGTISTKEELKWPGMGHFDRRHLLRHELIWPNGLPPQPQVLDSRPLPDIQDARLVRINHRSFRVYEGGRSRQASQTKG
mgnify:CR=1 FL=1